MLRQCRLSAQGRRKAFYFLPGHVEWFNRYRPLPQSLFQTQSEAHPLIATRMDLVDEARLLCMTCMSEGNNHDEPRVQDHLLRLAL